MEYEMDTVCAICGETYGKHYGLSCRSGGPKSFVAAAPTGREKPQRDPSEMRDRLHQPQVAAWRTPRPFRRFEGFTIVFRSDAQEKPADHPLLRVREM